MNVSVHLCVRTIQKYVNCLVAYVLFTTKHERNALLMIDEIYVAKRAEYSAGEIYGLASDGSIASTFLCFMVKSVGGKYKDLVGI